MAKLLKDMTRREFCNDCGVSIGELHIDGCDTESCTECSLQRISCECDSDNREKWTGISFERMLKICEEKNLYTKFESGKGWVPASQDDPKSQHDLNRAASFLQTKK
jgi:hypothetical protein